MDTSLNGLYLVASYNDGSIWLYDIDQLSPYNHFMCRKNGASLIQWTGCANTVIIASTKKNENGYSISYLSLYDNQYLRFFEGHKESILSLSMNPLNDSFLSSSLDNTIRVWDLRVNETQAMIQNVFEPISKFHPNGNFFGVVSPNSFTDRNNSIMKIFDMRSLERGPLYSIYLGESNNQFTSIDFKNDKAVTVSDSAYIVNWKTGEPICKYFNCFGDCSFDIGQSDKLFIGSNNSTKIVSDTKELSSLPGAASFININPTRELIHIGYDLFIRLYAPED